MEKITLTYTNDEGRKVATVMLQVLSYEIPCVAKLEIPDGGAYPEGLTFIEDGSTDFLRRELRNWAEARGFTEREESTGTADLTLDGDVREITA